MSRKDGEPVNFVITKRFDDGGKTYLPSENYLWDVRTFKEFSIKNSESIFDIDSVEPKEKTLEELLEELNYDGKVEGMPIRFVVMKDFKFRGQEYYRGFVKELSEQTYKDLLHNNRSHTYLVKMYAEDWIKETIEKQKELIKRFDMIQELTGIDVRTKDNDPIYATLEKENIGDNNRGGVSQDYYDLQCLESKATKYESDIISDKTPNTPKKPYTKRSSN